MDYKYNIKAWLKALPFKERIVMRERIETALGVKGIQTSRYINTVITEHLELDLEQMTAIADLFGKSWQDVLTPQYLSYQKQNIEKQLAALNES